ncbi:MAG: hypothetical protein U0703_14260 [Anaerolineae bacterium]
MQHLVFVVEETNLTSGDRAARSGAGSRQRKAIGRGCRAVLYNVLSTFSTPIAPAWRVRSLAARGSWRIPPAP